ncbi:MAG TPA: hypothetical protein VMY43_10245 [Methanothrix sp.]|nr:hypothetical protein [Methanothrix sp.]
MKFLLAATLMLVLSAMAIAVPDSQQLGPYSVSFDMNTDLPHQIMVSEPIQAQSATFYSMQIFTDNTTKAILTVSEYANPIDSTQGLYKQIAVMNMALNGFNTTNVEDKIITGKEGFLISGVPFPGNTIIPADAKLFNALCWMDSQGCECGAVSVGTTSVDITSSYPQDVTESLLSSLQIVKGGATSSALPAPSTQGGQVLPPE